MLLINYSSDERKRFVPLEELLLTADFLKLSRAQRIFVLRYIREGLATGRYDAVAATKAAYPRATKNANIRSYQLLAGKKIRTLLALYFREGELSTLLSDLKRVVKKSTKQGLGLTPQIAHALVTFEKFVEKSNA